MKRILSVLVLAAGVGAAGYCLYLMAIGRFFTGHSLGNWMILAIGAGFAVLGTVGLLRSRRTPADPARRRMALLAAAAVLLVGAGIGGYLGAMRVRETRYQTGLETLLRTCRREAFSASDAAPPETVRYNFYESATDRYTPQTTSGWRYLYVDPSKLTVLVGWRSGTEEIGYWATTGGVYLDHAYTQYLDLQVIRVSDWALIGERRLYPERTDANLDGSTFSISLNSPEVKQYLDGLWK